MNDIDESYSTSVEKFCRIPMIAEILSQLKEGLSSELCFHSYEHTIDVLNEAIYFAHCDGLSSRQQELLAIAAAFHDVGFLVRRWNNEQLGAQRAREAMKASGGYSSAEINLVEQAILDTKLIQTSHGPRQFANGELSPYLLDADLSNLGRVDFLERLNLQSREDGIEEELSLQKALELIRNHTWHTPAAKALRSSQQIKNTKQLEERLDLVGETDHCLRYLGVRLDRLGFLIRLPLIVNSSLEIKDVAQQALRHLVGRVGAEAGTVYLLDRRTGELTFWALEGKARILEGKRMPSDQGIVGWTINHRESVLVNNVAQDVRFFAEIDREIGFQTQSVISVPLLVHSRDCLGVLQVINCSREQGFHTDDLIFTEHVANQVALALENASLHETLEGRHQRLQHLEQGRNAIISVLAEQLAAPLHSLQEVVAALRESAIDENSKVLLSDKLLASSKLLENSIDVIRRLPLITEQPLEIKPMLVRLDEVFKRLDERFAEVCSGRELIFKTAVAAGADLVLADPELIEVALSNLLTNAVCFTPDGGQVSLFAVPNAGVVELSVSDNGKGFTTGGSPLVLKDFSNFSEVSSVGDCDFQFGSKGVGLGLPITEAIARAHGSTLDIESKPGIGSTVRFYLQTR